MNADEAELKRKKKMTAAITCLVAGLVVIIPLWFQWLKMAKGYDVGMTLLDYKECHQDHCESVSNFKLVDIINHDKHRTSGAFAYFGLLTIIVSMAAGLASIAAGALGLKGKFIRSPVAITTVSLLGMCLALILACIFVASKPGDGPGGAALGLSWPFFVFGVGVLGGIAGAQMLAKAFSETTDPYWDGVGPEPQ